MSSDISISESCLEHSAEHFRCNHCSATIKDYRFKCLSCHDFDLCYACALLTEVEFQNSSHTTGHILWKLDISFKCAMDRAESDCAGSDTIQTFYQGFALLDAMELYGQDITSIAHYLCWPLSCTIRAMKNLFSLPDEPLQYPNAQELRLKSQPPMLPLRVQWDQLVLIADDDDGILFMLYASYLWIEAAVNTLWWADVGVNSALDENHLIRHYLLFSRLGHAIDAMLCTGVGLFNTELLRLLLQNLLNYTTPRNTKRIQEARQELRGALKDMPTQNSVNKHQEVDNLLSALHRYQACMTSAMKKNIPILQGSNDNCTENQSDEKEFDCVCSPPKTPLHSPCDTPPPRKRCRSEKHNTTPLQRSPTFDETNKDTHIALAATPQGNRARHTITQELYDDPPAEYKNTTAINTAQELTENEYSAFFDRLIATHCSSVSWFDIKHYSYLAERCKAVEPPTPSVETCSSAAAQAGACLRLTRGQVIRLSEKMTIYPRHLAIFLEWCGMDPVANAAKKDDWMKILLLDTTDAIFISESKCAPEAATADDFQTTLDSMVIRSAINPPIEITLQGITANYNDWPPLSWIVSSCVLDEVLKQRGAFEMI